MVENNTKKPKDASQDAEKDTKKLIEAHQMVLKNKLQRAPTIEEIAEALKGNEVSAQPTAIPQEEVPENTAEPKILHLKVYYGMGKKKGEKGETREHDPSKVLFYEGHDGKVYDCGQQAWLDNRPDVLDHLPSRPLQYDAKNMDILRALVNGVVDDEDYAALDKSGVLNDDTKKVYALHKRANELHQQIQSLEKSEEPEIDEGADDIVPPNDAMSPNSPAPQGVNVIKDYFAVAGVQMGLEQVKESFGETGVDLFQQILVAALADVDEQTRMLVREEMESYLGPITEALQLLATHVGIDMSQLGSEPEVAISTEETGPFDSSVLDEQTGPDEDFS